MPKFDYNKSYATAEKLIEKFGGVGTITRQTITPPDETKPWLDPVVVNTDYSIKMVIVPWSATDDRRFFGEDLISSTSKGLILWPDDIELRVDDKITYEGRTWIYAKGKTIKPTSIGILYVAALSGGEA